jgi:glycosyltransferase involved in cell wall biosynthesis
VCNQSGDEMKRNVWFLNHYASPPDGSTGTRHFDIGRELTRRGYRITIFAASFNHWTKQDRLSPDEAWRIESYDGVRFVWLRTLSYEGNGVGRFLNMLSYTFHVLQFGTQFDEVPEVIIGSCVHPFAVLAGYILSLIKRCRFFFEVRDLWPQTLIDMGLLPERSFITNNLRRMEAFLYRRAEIIITLLPMAHEYITSLGIPRSKIIWIPNGVNTSLYDQIQAYEGGRYPFKIFYIGAHGQANALDVVLKSALILQQQNEQAVRFIFVGDGPKKQALIQYAHEVGLVNVEFRNPVPKQKVPDVMSEADAFVFNLENLPVFRFGISPNKLFDYLAAGRPILFSASSANNPVAEAQAGLTVPPENAPALAQAVEKLISMLPEERVQMGLNGRAYVRRFHSVEQLVDKFEAILR